MAFLMGLARGVIIRAALENGLLGVLGKESGCGDGVAEVGFGNPNAGTVIAGSEFISTSSLIAGDGIDLIVYNSHSFLCYLSFESFVSR